MNIPDHIKLDLTTCKSCTLYTSGFKTFVPPDGPLNPQLIKIGEAPGQTEVKKGIPFCGKAGIEDTRYSKEVGIYRHNTYVTNVCKCRPPENRDPTEHEISCCSYVLKQELQAVNTDYIACLGRIASRWFLGQDLDMEAVHGIPFFLYKKVLGIIMAYGMEIDQTYNALSDTIIIPMYHPAYGLHDPRNMIFVESDYKALGEIVKGRVIPRELRYDAGEYNHYEEIKDITEISEGWFSLQDYIAVDTESGNNIPWCLTFSYRSNEAYLIKANNKAVLVKFNELLQKQKKIIVLHNAKYDIPVLESMGIQVNKFEDTMIMAYLLQDIPKGLKPLAYRIANIKMEDYNDIVKPAQESKSLVYLCEILEHTWPDPAPIEQVLASGKHHIKHPQNIAKKVKRIVNDYQKNPQLDLWKRWHNIKLNEGRKLVEDKLGSMPQASLSDIQFSDALKYACRDAAATFAIYPHLKQRIINLGLEETYNRDLGIIHWLIDAEKHGMLVDVPYLKELTQHFNITMDELRIQIMYMYAKETQAQTQTPYIVKFEKDKNIEIETKYINPSSTQQIAKVLYDLGLIKSKLASTDSHALDKIRSKHPIVNLITAYRELKKLRGTYSEKLPLWTDKDNYVHTNINNAKTATGRLSSDDPNLQNIPIRTETGRKIKRAFISPPGCKILSSDYSQIEMRMAAHSSQDLRMMQIFNDDQDIHSMTASWVFNIPLEEVDSMKHRYPCKHIGFSILYSITGIGLRTKMLAEGIDYSEKYCDELIDAWYEVYPGIRRYMDMLRYQARSKGLVRDFMGRYRLLPGAKSNLTYIKNEALRQATNMPQSDAGHIIKEAMKQLWPMYKDLTQGGKYIVQPVMQIHDDLLHYVSEEIVQDIAPIIRSVMENAITLSVPVKVDQKVGYNWLEMEKI